MEQKYKDFFAKYNGVPNVGNTDINKGECVGLVSVFMDVFGIPHVWGHAKDLFYNAPDQYFEKILNTIEVLPTTGDIMCMDGGVGGGLGHTGVASKTGAQLTFEMFQQNDPTGTSPQLKTYIYDHVIGWLRVKNIGATPQPPLEFIVGNDVAEYQGDIDWDTYKNNTNFVIIRSTYGTGKQDLKFVRNKDEARRVGVPHGFYHYAYPNLNTPESEADWCLMQISDIREEESIILDFEEAYDGDKVDWCKRFLDRVAEKRNGYKALIYLNQSLCKNNDWTPVVNAGYKLWIAAYTYSPLINNYEIGVWPKATIQQWTNQQQVPGIVGNVDGDVFFGNLDGFKSLGYKKPVIVTPPITPPTDPIDPCATYKSILEATNKTVDNLNGQIVILKNQAIQKDLSIVTMGDEILDLKDKLKNIPICPPQTDCTQFINKIAYVKSVLWGKGFWWVKLKNLKAMFPK